MVVKPTTPSTTEPAVAPTTAPTTPPAPQKPTESVTEVYLYGDVDFSNAITVKDATMVQKFCTGLEALNALQQEVAKVTGRTTVTIKDATAIQKYVAGVLSVFTAGKWYTGGGTIVPTTPTTAPTAAPTEAPTAPAPTTPSDSSKNTVYFKNTSGWGGVNAYVWSSSTGEAANGAWPGSAMTYVSGDVYKITLDKKYDMIIFSNNGGNQSADLSIPGNNQIFNYASGSWSEFDGNTNSGGNSGGNSGTSSQGKITIYFVDTNGWGSAKVICWTNNSNQRDEITMQSCGDNKYVVQIDKKYDKLYFTNGNQKSQDFNVPENGGTYTYNYGWS